MIVSQTSINGTVVTSPPSSEAKSNMDYDSFLKLLVATMQNQDPTKPNDPAETLSQLASFSSVEQGIKTNSKLEGLLAISAAGQAASLVGRTVTSSDGSVSGVVTGIEIGSSGLVATLSSGSKVTLDVGTRIS